MNKIEELYLGEFEFIVINGKYSSLQIINQNQILIPGSFNPLHEGHIGIYEYCINNTSYIPYFELSILNIDKGIIEKEDLYNRIQQFTYYNLNLIITRYPTFLMKSNICKKFAVGMDTYNRIIDKKYYLNNDFLLSQLSNLEFFVFNRNENPKDCNIKWNVSPKFIDYNVDISSSKLRLNLD